MEKELPKENWIPLTPPQKTEEDQSEIERPVNAVKKLDLETPLEEEEVLSKAKEGNNGEGVKVEVSGQKRKRKKKKKYWPKIEVERVAKKAKVQTPGVQTPKKKKPPPTPKPSTPNCVNRDTEVAPKPNNSVIDCQKVRRKYVRKKNQQPQTPLKCEVIDTGVTLIPNNSVGIEGFDCQKVSRKYVRKKKPNQTPTQKPSTPECMIAAIEVTPETNCSVENKKSDHQRYNVKFKRRNRQDQAPCSQTPKKEAPSRPKRVTRKRSSVGNIDDYCLRLSNELRPNFPATCKRKRVKRRRVFILYGLCWKSKRMRSRISRHRRTTTEGSLDAKMCRKDNSAGVIKPGCLKFLVRLSPMVKQKLMKIKRPKRRITSASKRKIPKCYQMPSTTAQAFTSQMHELGEKGSGASMAIVLADTGVVRGEDSIDTPSGATLVYPYALEGCPPQCMDLVPIARNSKKLSTSDSPGSIARLLKVIIKKLQNLHISDAGRQLVVRGQNSASRKPKLQVHLDSESLRVWNLLIANGGSSYMEEEDEEKKKWWEAERQVFRGRVDSFIAKMHIILGDRRFSPWKGSVIDSVVGVYLTQNVSDFLSSSAFMSLAAQFPLHSPNNHKEHGEGDLLGREEWTETTLQIESCSSVDVNLDIDDERVNEKILQTEVPLLVDVNLNINDQKANEKILQTEIPSLVDVNSNINGQTINENILQTDTLPMEGLNSSINDRERIEMILETENPSTEKKTKGKEKPAETIDWDELRKTYSDGRERDPEGDTADSVDWEAVRQADCEIVANAIKERGQHNIIGRRIQDFLNRVVKDHGSLDLEWLRNVPPEKTKEYLLSIEGLGLKSVECIRLLALHHHAFPVDTNVGRIAVRLGWVPLKPLPHNLQFHLLEDYPIMNDIQKYLWPRLSTLDQPTLYELHYQMITFGKVFCTKRSPKCGACPMKGECRHYASVVASARQALPSTKAGSVVNSKDLASFAQNPAKHNYPGSNYQNTSSEPIIEYPPSPEPERTEMQQQELPDMEDFCREPNDDMITFRLNHQESEENSSRYITENNNSKALVVLPPEVASRPVAKLKYVTRLRTVHRVYELPDSHPLLENLDKRDPDDPSQYLLAIWPEGEAANSCASNKEHCDSKELVPYNEYSDFQQQQHGTVKGTILLPLRTALRARFPLNATYFQVNEVFVDDETMRQPLNVPRALIWNLQRRLLFCGTSIQTISKGLSIMDISHCFGEGYICVRGFDRRTRAPRPLGLKFHIPPKETAKKKEQANE